MLDHMKTGVTRALALCIIAAWLCGAFSYAREGNFSGAAGAFVGPPIGVLHTLGAF